jgi:uncharacterized SAM-binding protein YcdF (DUF218 family)
MFFVISKLFAFLLNPMFWIFYLLLVVVLKFTLSFEHIQNRKGFRRFLLNYIQNIHVKKYLITTFVIFMICGNGVIMNEINIWWEGSHANKSISAITPNDKPYPRTAVVLGGYLGYDIPRNRYRLMSAGDRFMVGFQGIQLGKFDRVILTGGSSSIINHVYYEAFEARNYMISLGVDSNKIIVDGKSRNTYENAIITKHLLDSLNIHEPVCLITSAGHMYRSAACYKKAGVKFVPYKAHFTSSMQRNYSFSNFFIPSAGAFEKLDDFIHEWIGILSYKISGKI